MRQLCMVLLGFMIGYRPAPAQEHPTDDLTVRELLDVMADFDVRHVDQQPIQKPLYGVTVFDSLPPTIYIFSAQTHYSKMSTIIHEAIHIRCSRAGVDCKDDWVNEEEVQAVPAPRDGPMKTTTLILDQVDSECYITKRELWLGALGHVGRAFTAWPLKRRYGHRDWRMAADFLDNARLCLRSSWSARWR